nr:MAG TPA: hypothetical protein [Bacteriophage sp.]
MALNKGAGDSNFPCPFATLKSEKSSDNPI